MRIVIECIPCSWLMLTWEIITQLDLWGPSNIWELNWRSERMRLRISSFSKIECLGRNLFCFQDHRPTRLPSFHVLCIANQFDDAQRNWWLLHTTNQLSPNFGSLRCYICQIAGIERKNPPWPSTWGNSVQVWTLEPATIMLVQKLGHSLLPRCSWWGKLSTKFQEGYVIWLYHHDSCGKCVRHWVTWHCCKGIKLQ